MKGCLKFTTHSYPGSPCISPAPSSSSSSHDGSTTTTSSTASDPSHSDSTLTGTTTSSSSQSGSSTPPHVRSRKCVDFGEKICAEFFVADDWDRTPTEPARKLSYQDLLELKEIQRSLPRANQPPDDYVGRGAKCYLRAVPIGLLPLLPDSNPTTPLSTPVTTPTVEPARNPLSASSSPEASGASSPLRGASPERGATTPGQSSSSSTNDGVSASTNGSTNGSTNAPWCPVNYHRMRAPPPPVAPAYAPSSSADSPCASALGSRFAKFPYPPSPLHRGATPPPSSSSSSTSSTTSQEPVKDKRLAHLPAGPKVPPRKKPMFAFLPLLAGEGEAGPTAPAHEPPSSVKDEAKKKAEEKEREATPKPPTLTLTSTRDASREPEEEDGSAQVEPEWPRHVYGHGSASKSASPTSPLATRSPISGTSSGTRSRNGSVSAPPTAVAFKKPVVNNGGFHGGFGSAYSGYVPPPPVRMVAASGLGMPIKNLTTHSAGPSVSNNSTTSFSSTSTSSSSASGLTVKDETSYYASHMHPYSPGSSRAGSVAGSRNASVERGGERERRLFAPHAQFAAALLRVDELVQRAADEEEGASLGGVGEDGEEEERSGRSEKKMAAPSRKEKGRKAKKVVKKEKRFIMVNDMQIELDGSDDEGVGAEDPEDDYAEDDDMDADADADFVGTSSNPNVHAEIGSDSDSGRMSLKAALETPMTPPTVYAYQLPTPTPTPPPVLLSSTNSASGPGAATVTPSTPVGVRSPAKTPTPSSVSSSSSVAAPTDVEPVRATTPTPINVMAPIRFKRAVPPSQGQRS